MHDKVLEKIQSRCRSFRDKAPNLLIVHGNEPRAEIAQLAERLSKVGHHVAIAGLPEIQRLHKYQQVLIDRTAEYELKINWERGSRERLNDIFSSAVILPDKNKSYKKRTKFDQLNDSRNSKNGFR